MLMNHVCVMIICWWSILSYKDIKG